MTIKVIKFDMCHWFDRIGMTINSNYKKGFKLAVKNCHLKKCNKSNAIGEME